MRSLLFGLACIFFAAPAGAETDPARVDAARGLEGRLLAPCCFKQTLDIHHSPLADQVRAEIYQRIGGGEEVAQVEQDLIRRYGKEILAIPHAGFLDPYGVALLGGTGAMAIALFWIAKRRWVAAPAAPEPPPAQSGAAKSELDRELAALDP
jgi:cytochrome c-type biogenesis protein CcmH